jgi:hypothetical protein
MRPFLLAVALFAVCHAQDLVPRWQDDFSRDRELADTRARWSLTGQEWQLDQGVLVAAGKGTLLGTPLRVPGGDRQIIDVQLTLRKRLAENGWAVAGLLLQQDPANYWQLAICEGPPPERLHYVELAEKFQGTWKANSVGTTALSALDGKGSFAWQYGVPYRVRLAVDGKTIRGTFRDAAGKLLGELGYELRPGQSVTSGQLTLRMLGMETAVAKVSIQAPAPPDPESLGVDIVDGARGRVAILADRLPGHDQALVDLYAKALTAQGFGVTRLTGQQLARPGVLTRDNFAVLALVPADSYPATATEPIRHFLRQGGNLLTVGGKPFARPCMPVDGGWLSRNQARQQLADTRPTHLLLGFEKAEDAAGWQRNSNNVGKTASDVSLAQPGAAGTGNCLAVDIRGYSGWDTFAREGLKTPFPGNNKLTCLWLKAAPQTKEIAVEWREQDGARWIATVPTTPDWRHVVLAPTDFKFWAQGSPKGRGGKGDLLNPQAAVQLNIGVAGSHTSIPKGNHQFWVDQIGTAPWPMPPEILDRQSSLDLDMFSDAYPWEQLAGCTRLHWEPLGDDGPDLPASLAGPSVLGFPKPGLSLFRPLLSAWDKQGRRQANAGGMLIHYAGAYRGARWAVFTPNEHGLLRNPDFVAGVANAATRLLAPLCVVEGAPERWSYRPGEASSLPVGVQSLGEKPTTATVRLQILSAGKVAHSAEQTVEIAAARLAKTQFTWRAPAQPGGFSVHLEVWANGSLSDVLEDQFRVEAQSPQGACRGPLRLSDDGKHLVYPDGNRFFCIGANYTGAFDSHGRFFRDEFFSPRTLEAHFAASRAAGINAWRSCGWCWSPVWAEEILRGDFHKVDLYMDLAARYGVYQLLAPPGVHERSIEKRLAVYTALAKHLRGHPALLGYDLQNEPEVVRLTGIKYPADAPCPTQRFDFLAAYPDLLKPKLADLRQMAKERRFWRNALSPELTDEQAFHVVCAAYLYAQWRREYHITFSTFPEIGEAWPPAPKWKPLLDAIDAGLAAYVDIQSKALKQADPQALVTVGYNQCLSVFPGNRTLDFVSQHVYQRPYEFSDIRSNITTLDRLEKIWPDKPITLGEFGYSNGIEMRDGKHLSVHESAVGEMIHWLYAIDRGYDGCKKWVLNDHPLSYMHHFGNWAGRGLRTQVYEERFGIYAWDGSALGHRKPIGIALAALRRYIDRAGPKGKLTIRQGEANAKAFYQLTGDKALFIGSMEHHADGVDFSSPVPLTLALDWGEGALSLTATADATVRLNPRPYLNLPVGQCLVAGATSRMVGTTLRIELLAGQTVTVSGRR